MDVNRSLAANRGRRRGLLLVLLTATALIAGAFAAVSAADEDLPELTDEYSQQVARLKEVTVDTSQYKKDPPYTIATIVEGPINGWGQIFDTTMDARMEETGKFDMEKRLYVPWNYDAANQAKGIEDAVAQGVDAILLTPLSRAALAAPVERAIEAGIPVILCMAGVQTDKYTAEVSAEIPRMGYENAKAIAEKLDGRGTVVVLHGIAGVDAMEYGKIGADVAWAEYPDLRVVEQYGNWTTGDALNVMRTIIVQEPEIDAIYVGGFEMAVGAIQALKEVGRPIPFISGSSITNGFLRIAADEGLDFYAIQFPPAGSKVCVDKVVDVLEGNPVQQYTSVWDVLPGVDPFGPEGLADIYRPQFDDNFVGPTFYSDDVYEEAGF